LNFDHDHGRKYWRGVRWGTTLTIENLRFFARQQWKNVCFTLKFHLPPQLSLPKNQEMPHRHQKIAAKSKKMFTPLTFGPYLRP
jgi:hypothetical protein